MVCIKEMYMPEKCIECPFYSGVTGGKCLVDAHNFDSNSMHSPEYERQEWCPLSEVEERGGAVG